MTADGYPAATLAFLSAAAQRHGTPLYAYDLAAVRNRVKALRAHVPAGTDVYYCLKANRTAELCRLIAGEGLGAEVSSAEELAVARRVGFPLTRVFVSGPYKPPGLIRAAARWPGAVLSIDSADELRVLAASGHRCDVVLRLRPDYPVPGEACRSAPRFGIPPGELAGLPRQSELGGLRLVGFHVSAGSQICRTEDVVRGLDGAAALAHRAAAALGVAPRLINLGGGFGVRYGPGDTEPDLATVGAWLRTAVAAAGGARLAIELGRYVVAPAGWYLTRVVARQSRMGRPAVVVDGGIHQRADCCGLGMSVRSWPPVVLGAGGLAARPTDVLGSLCLPGDVLAEAAALPALPLGTVLAFPNWGAYGLTASPVHFLGHPMPEVVVFDGGQISPARPGLPSPAGEALDGVPT